ncbi:SGNH/GDSL hydrolase family protein [Mycoplasmopsis agassizii]|uniref:SGNH/GDSL hydrolase family protein n=1 Tax=Mycoplasmopsis agassizii TaxID=33922 RepID=UPI0009D8178E|nr:SGNH/GDSL hydrolase family protein [Mycoplasmopsis agassizii]SMC16883.1 Lysophospholipase L1 [Mycoplasmopsis agassizii]
MSLNRKSKLILIGAATTAVIAASAAGIVVGVRNNNQSANPGLKNPDLPAKDNPVSPAESSSKLAKEINTNLVVRRNNATATINASVEATVDENKLLSSEVKYVAFGDSITAGFNAKLATDYPGELKVVNGESQIDGLSFPSFIAKFINQIEPGKLTAYKNFGVTGSTLKDWNQLFSNDTNGRIAQGMGEGFSEFRSDFIARLTSANLLTVSLGANDFMDILFNQIGTIDFQKLLAGGSFDMKNLIEIVVPILTEVRTQIRNSYTELINHIKTYNKDIKINLISYPMPFLRLLETVNQLTKGVEIEPGKPLSKYLLGILNGLIKDRSTLDDSVNYINVYDENDWDNNAKLYTSQILDIHPTEIGYKKIAQDILLKLSINRSLYTNQTSINPSWDEEYVKTDEDQNGFTIKFSKTDFEIIKTILGANNDELTRKNDELITKYESLFDTSQFPSRIITRSGFQNTLKSVTLMLLSSDAIKLVDPEQELFKFFTKNSEDLDNVILKLYDSNFISNLWNNFQNTSNEILKNKDKLDSTDVINSAVHAISDLDNFHGLLVSLFNSNIFAKKELNTELQTIIKKIITTLFNQKDLLNKGVDFIAGLLPKSVLTENGIPLVKAIVNSNLLVEFLNGLVSDVFDNQDEYAKTKNFKELFVIYLNKNKATFINLIKGIFTTLSKDAPVEFSALFGYIGQSFLQSSGIKLDSSELKQILVLVNDLVLTAVNSDLFDLLFEQVITSLKASDSLDFTVLINHVIGSLTSGDGLFKIVQSLLRSEYLKVNNNNLKVAETFKAVIKSLLKSTTVRTMISSLLISENASEKEKLAYHTNILISEILDDPKTILFLDNFVNSIFSNLQRYNSFDTFNKFLNFLFTSQRNNVVDYLNYLVSKLATLNSSLSVVALSKVQELLPGVKLSFNDAQSKNFSTVLSTLLQAVSHSTLINDVYSKFIRNIESNKAFNLNEILENVLDTENGFYSLIKTVLRSTTWLDNKTREDFTTALTSFILETVKSEDIMNFIVGDIVNHLSIPEHLILRTTWTTIFSLEDIKTLITSLINTATNSQDNAWLDEVENLNQFIFKAVIKDRTIFAEKIKSLINMLVNSSASGLVFDLFTKQIDHLFELKLSEENRSRLSAFFKQSMTIVAQSEIADAAFDIIEKGLLTSKTSFKSLTQLFDDLFFTSESIWKLVKTLLKAEFWNNPENKSTYQENLNFITYLLLRNTGVKKFVTAQIDTILKSQLKIDFIDVENIDILVSAIVENDKTASFIKNIINGLFTDFDLYKDQERLEDVIVLFLSKNDTVVNSYLSEITAELTSIDGALNQVIFAQLIKYAKLNNFSIDDAALTQFKKLLQSFGKVIASSDIYKTVLEKLKATLQNKWLSFKTIEELIFNVVDLDNGFFNLVKTIANSSEWKNQETKNDIKYGIKQIFAALVSNSKASADLLTSLGFIPANSDIYNAISKDAGRLLGSDEFQAFMDQILEIALNSNRYFLISNSWSDLIFNIVKLQDVSSITNSLSKLLNKVVTDYSELLNSSLGMVLNTLGSSYDLVFSKDDLAAVNNAISKFLLIIFDNKFLNDYIDRIKQNSSFETFDQLMSNYIFSEKGLYDLITTFANGSYLQEKANREDVAKTLKSVFTVLKTNPTFKKSLAKIFLQLFSASTDEKTVEIIQKAFTKLIDDKETESFISAFIDSLILDIDSYKSLSSLNEIVLTYLGKNKNTFINYINHVITNYLVKDINFQITFSKPLFSIAKSLNITFSNDEEKIIYQLIGDFSRIVSESGLITTLIAQLETSLKDKTLSVSDVFNNLINSYFADDKSLLNLLKVILSSNAFKDNALNASFKNNLKSIIFVALKNESVFELIFKNLNIENNDLKNAFKDIVNTAINEDSFKEIVDQLLDAVFVDFSWFEKAQNFEQLIIYFLKNKSEKMLPLIANIFEKISTNNLDSLLKIFNFSTDLFLPQLSSELTTTQKNNIAQLIINVVKATMNSEVPKILIQKIKTSGESVISFEGLISELLSSPDTIFQVVKAITNSELLKDDLTAARNAELVDLTIDSLLKSEFVFNILKGFSASLFKLESDQENVNDLIKLIINSDDTTTFIKEMLRSIFTNKDRYQDAKNLDQFVIQFLRINKNTVVNFIKNTLEKVSGNVTFEKAVKSLVKMVGEQMETPFSDEEMDAIYLVLDDAIVLFSDGQFINSIFDRFIQAAEKNTNNGESFFANNSLINSVILTVLDADNMFWNTFKLALSSKHFANGRASQLGQNLYVLLTRLFKNTQFLEKFTTSFDPDDNSLFAKSLGGFATNLFAQDSFKALYTKAFEVLEDIAKNNWTEKFTNWDSLYAFIFDRERAFVKKNLVALMQNVIKNNFDSNLENVMAVFINPMFKNAGINLLPGDEKQYIPFFKTLLQQLIDNPLIIEIIEETVDEITDSKVSNFQLVNITNKIFDTLLKHISTSSGLQISSLINLANNILGYFNSEEHGKYFADFFNLLFTRSDLTKTNNGIYDILLGFVHPGAKIGSATNQQPANPSQGGGASTPGAPDNTSGAGLAIPGLDVGDLVANVQKAIDFVYSFMETITYRVAQAQASWQIANPTVDYTLNPYFNANYRFVALILWWAKQIIPEGLFWTGLNGTIEVSRYITESSNRGFMKAFNEKRTALTATGMNLYTQDWNQISTIVGDTGHWVRYWNYDRVSLIAYLYYELDKSNWGLTNVVDPIRNHEAKNLSVDRHRNYATMRDVIINWLKYGYSKDLTREDFYK